MLAERGALEIQRRLAPGVASRVDLRRRAAGEVCALFGSTDHLEIAANGASAAAVLDLGRGATGARRPPRVIAIPARFLMHCHHLTCNL